ncbi:hypothetical protein XENOCAPTIV_009086 [Xenoophorus captivus]|uniref:Uncharacterized protein n=2 Tax=Goodeidae TaxID=28758 RepID=A0ABV0QHA5_9TELE
MRGLFKSTHAPCFLTKYLLTRCSYQFSISLLVSFTFDILPGPVSTSHVICCSRYPSSQRATGVGEKFLPQIKWSEIKMLPQHVPLAGDFEGDKPSRCARRNASVSQNNKSTV